MKSAAFIANLLQLFCLVVMAFLCVYATGALAVLGWIAFTLQTTATATIMAIGNKKDASFSR